MLQDDEKGISLKIVNYTMKYEQERFYHYQPCFSITYCTIWDSKQQQ